MKGFKHNQEIMLNKIKVKQIKNTQIYEEQKRTFLIGQGFKWCVSV